ncbi:MAG TPA: aminotransferase class III-fold pyridoxal phosphate-dependent enzyme [Thermomicrobiaceae bacterium]|nr:aminotransferase class III-fold pyridoxal phosphate-dependent enzyme [Thermomicrobiaceae bacterium]
MTAEQARTIEQEYVESHPSSAENYRRAVAAIPRGVTHDVRFLKPFPLYMTRALGSKKWDVDGHEIIDYAMGHGALILGHSNPAVVEAVSEQVHRGTHYGGSHELEVEWASRVANLVPSIESVEFTSSGTEATLMAMRLARAFTGREKIMKFAGHFHGWHDYAIVGEQISGEARRAPGVPPQIYETMVVAPNNDLDFVAKRLAERDVAAVILEPSGASYATIPLPEGFLERLRELTSETGTLLIFDEVITGFRWSPGGKQAKVGVTPDMTTLAKILAGGLPGGAVGGRADIMELLDFNNETGKKIGHPGTYNANPVSAAAGNAALSLVADPGVQQHADALAKQLRAGFNQAIVAQGVPGFAWGESSAFHTMLGREVGNQSGGDIHTPQGVPAAELKAGSPARLGQPLQLGMLNLGVDLFHGGGFTSSAHTPQDIERTVAAFEQTLARMKREGLFG